MSNILIGKKITLTYTKYDTTLQKAIPVKELVTFLGFGLYCDEYTEGNPTVTGAIILFDNGRCHIENLQLLNFKEVGDE